MNTPSIHGWILQRGEDHALGGASCEDDSRLPIEKVLADNNLDVFRATVLVCPWTVAVTANVEQAVVLSQLAYWINGPRQTHSISADPGRGLMGVNTARSSPQIADATGQTSHGVDHVLDRLQAAGLIAWKCTYFAGQKVRHIWLTAEALQAASQPPEGRPVAFKVWLAKYLASVPGEKKVSTATIAYIASQLYYWYSRRTNDRRPLVSPPEPEAGLNEYWFYKRNTDLSDELGLNRTMVNRAMSVLKKTKLIEVQCTMKGGKRTGQVMLISSAWQAAIAKVSMTNEEKK